MSGHGKRWTTKHQLLDLMHVLQRPVEFAGESGHPVIWSNSDQCGRFRHFGDY